MYKYTLLVLLSIAMSARAMDPAQEGFVEEADPLSDSIVVVPSSASSTLHFQNFPDEDFFNERGLSAGHAQNALSTLFYYPNSERKKEAHTLMQEYIAESSQRGENLLQQLKDLKISTKGAEHDFGVKLEQARNMKNIWELGARTQQAENLKLKKKVFALSATSVGLAGLAAYLYFKKT